MTDRLSPEGEELYSAAEDWCHAMHMAVIYHEAGSDAYAKWAKLEEERENGLVALLAQHFPVEAPTIEDPYEYHMTTGPRQTWDGEPDLTIDGWERLAWQRFEHHEVQHWRRLKHPLPKESP